MKSFALWPKIVLFALACLLIFGGMQLPLPSLTLLGFMVFGVLALLLGLEVIITRQAAFSRHRADQVVGYESYSGCTAQLWGGMFVLFGLGLVLGTLAALVRPQQTQAILDQAFEQPWGWGILIAGVGFFVAVYGLARLLAGGAMTIRGVGETVRHVGYRVFGAACLLIGAGLMALGLVLITSPETLSTLLQRWAPGLPLAF